MVCYRKRQGVILMSPPFSPTCDSNKADQLTIGLSASYRHFGNSSSPLSSAFKDGVDVGTFATWQFNDDFSATAGAYYDFGAEAWYGNAETQWSKAISEKTFVALNTGISYVDDYYGRDGINDAYGRLSLTHHLSDTVSITPLSGWLSALRQ